LFQRVYYRFPGDLASKERIMYSGAGCRGGHSRAVIDKKNVAGNEIFTNPPLK
jgi:hypothetical protein